MRPDNIEYHDISSFIYEPVYDSDGTLKDFRILYASDIFARDWVAIYHNEDYLGALLKESTLMDDYSLEMMERFITQTPHAFMTYMPMVNLHLYFEPIPDLPAPYAGFYLTNITSHAYRDTRDHFLRNIRQMGNNAVLIQRQDDGHLDAIFVSPEYARMMECSEAEAMARLSGIGIFKTTVADDRPPVRSMQERRVAFDGSSRLTIQKVTAKHNKVWVNAHYAFIDDFDEHYIYCTYTDVTTLKAHEERLRSTYSSLGNNFYQAGDLTLTNLRVNLTRNIFEEINGAEAIIYWQDERYGKVGPETFMPVLERDFIYEELGDFILERGMSDGMRFLEHDPSFLLCLNVSRIQLESGYFIDTLVHYLRATGFPPRQLSLKFDDGCLFIGMERLKSVIEALHERGILTIIEEYGSGSDSISFLRSEPVDAVSINSQLSRDIETDPKARNTLDHLTRMAAEYVAHINVKGVSNLRMREILRDFRVTTLQGSCFSDPLPRDALIQRYYA